MKYTSEQKQSIKGLNCLNQFKKQVAKKYNLHTCKFKIKDEFIIINSKMNENKCECKNSTFTRRVDSKFNPLCGKCGRKI